jgi:hypothetical protein
MFSYRHLLLLRTASVSHPFDDGVWSSRLLVSNKLRLALWTTKKTPPKWLILESKHIA